MSTKIAANGFESMPVPSRDGLWMEVATILGQDGIWPLSIQRSQLCIDSRTLA